MSAIAAMQSPAADVLTVVIRDATESDWPFIRDSWTNSVIQNKHLAAPDGLRRRLYDRIEKLRERGATFSVACSPEDHDQILGWTCHEKPIVHYVFVKEFFRLNGIARQLLSGFADQKIVLCSEWSQTAGKIGAKHKFLRKVLPC